MSVQDLTPEFDETTAEPEDLTVRRLVRAIDYAEGFWLGFAKSNTPAQRRRLAALCRDLLEPLKVRVLEIELTEPVADLLPLLLERLTQEATANDEKTTRPKLALFVHGLERSIPSREAYPPLLSSLNLKRELFRLDVPHPLLLWLPDYALTALARKAPDFWAWRSGLYEFAPERETAEQSLQAVRSEALYLTESLSEQAKRERLVMLKGLLEDYRELGEGLHEQKVKRSILSEIGLAHEALDEWTEAKRAYVDSLTIARDIKDREAEALALHHLGRIEQEWGDADEAHRLFDESLEIAKRLGSKPLIAVTLHRLGLSANAQGKIAEARRIYEESLEIDKSLGNQRGVAILLYQMGSLALKQGEWGDAARLLDESQQISKELGDEQGSVRALYQQGLLAQAQGELDSARRLYDDCLEISKRLGDQRGVANALNQLGSLAGNKGDNAEAARLFREALSILERLGSPGVEVVRRNLARTEDYNNAPD